MSQANLKGFFAYPSDPPSVGESIATAAQEINSGKLVELKTWEQCRVGGKVIIQEICKEIEQADLFCADLTGMNPNVMFELGFAIAQNKRIWLILDTSFSALKRQFDQLRVLTTVGYATYHNSLQIIETFYKDQPYQDPQVTIFNQAIEPSLQPDLEEKLLYLKSRVDTESSVRISKRIAVSPMPQIVNDPRESTAQTLTWYGVNTFSSLGVICHLMHPEREGALLHNARYALAAGIAYGMAKPLIMLTEGDFLAPLDYRDLLHHYKTATEALVYLEEWITPLEEHWRQSQSSRQGFIATVRLATELKGLQLGEPIAENEADRLVDFYFIETAAFQEAIEGKHTVFVGRKGSGKSANFLKLAATLRTDRRNLVCEIKPISYQLQSVAELIRRYRELDAKSYAVESLWKFLIYAEIANTLAQEILQRPSPELSPDETILMELMDREGGMLKKDFSIRLERCVEALAISQQGTNQTRGVENARMAVSEALHEGILKDLRLVLGRLLSNKKRVAVLIDNLDKAWDKQSDLTSLSEFFLGLLSAAKRVTMDFRREDSRRDAANLSVAIFLRSDIFYKIKEVAREPDKIYNSKLNWNDPELLLRVIEERFVALHAGNVVSSEMWDRYFCSTVRGIPTKDYFVKQVLCRPRDLIFFIKAAVATAVNRGHVMVQEKDVLEAEKLYSQFAVDSLLVENGVSIGSLETIIYEFLGSSPRLTYEEVKRLIRNANIPEGRIDEIIDYLCSLTFLGLEVRDNEYRFADDPQDNRKNQVLARKLSETRGASTRYMVNHAFWAFLEISE